jgi:hypothetical protein
MPGDEMRSVDDLPQMIHIYSRDEPESNPVLAMFPEWATLNNSSIWSLKYKT